MMIIFSDDCKLSLPSNAKELNCGQLTFLSNGRNHVTYHFWEYHMLNGKTQLDARYFIFNNVLIALNIALDNYTLYASQGQSIEMRYYLSSYYVNIFDELIVVSSVEFQSNKYIITY